MTRAKPLGNVPTHPAAAPNETIPTWIGRTSPARGTVSGPPESPLHDPCPWVVLIQTTEATMTDVPKTDAQAALVMIGAVATRRTADVAPVLVTRPHPETVAVSPTNNSLAKAVGRRVGWTAVLCVHAVGTSKIAISLFKLLGL